MRGTRYLRDAGTARCYVASGPQRNGGHSGVNDSPIRPRPIRHTVDPLGALRIQRGTLRHPGHPVRKLAELLAESLSAGGAATP